MKSCCPADATCEVIYYVAGLRVAGVLLYSLQFVCLYCLCNQEEKTRDKAFLLLLSKGANVNLQDSCGRTALSYACEMRCNDIVRILVRNNVDPDIADEKGLTLMRCGLQPQCWLAASDINHFVPRRLLLLLELILSFVRKFAVASTEIITVWIRLMGNCLFARYYYYNQH